MYTDGACSGNPGRGGWAWVLVENGSVVAQDSGASEMTTNNKMELQAVIEGLTYLSTKTAITEVHVFTDSTYVQQGITSWILKWKANGWKTANKQPVKNQELWQTLDSLAQKLSITWQWVKGHNNNQFNNLCDRLAVTAYQK